MWYYGFSSEDTVHGKWKEKNSNSNAETAVSSCVDDKEYSGSYTYVEDEETYEGYLVGKCSKNGKICRSDYYEYPDFGVQLDRLLSDGTLQTFWWLGPLTDIDATTLNATYLSNRVSKRATDDECSANSDSIAYPFKCLTFTSQEDCERNPYYCKVRETDGACMRINYNPDGGIPPPTI